MKFVSRMGKSTVLIALVLFPAVTRLISAQEPDSAIKVDVDVVNVLCTVHDREGLLVRDLKKDDFKIFEDGRPEQIRYFAQETDLPLTVALLLDVSGSVRWFVDDEKLAAAKFLEQVLRPQDHSLLVGFSSTIVLWQDLTSSVPLLQIALKRLRSVPFRGLPPLGEAMPSTLLYQAVQKTALDKLNAVSGRKVMIIISDGLDNGSPVHMEQVLEAVQSTNTIVYSICFESGFSGCSFLKDMAVPTGGRIFRAKKIPVATIFQIIESEMRSQYAIGYVSTNPAHDGTFRKLQVKVRPKGMKAAVRKGYYAAK